MEQAELPMKDVTPKKSAPAEPKQDPKPARKTRARAETKPAPKNEVAVANQNAGGALAAPGQPRSMLQIIAEAAANPAVNPENMRALLDMQKEIVAEERKQTFDASYIALQAELPVINRDGKIEVRQKDQHGERTGRLQQSTPYATFEAIMDEIQPLLTKHGFGLGFETRASGDRLLVIGHLTGHGHQRSTEFPLPAETSGSKNNVQGWGSSLSYGKRYCTIALLNIRSRAVQDRDTDGFPGDFAPAKGGGLAEKKTVETISTRQADDLREVMEDCGVSSRTLLDHYGIARVEDLPASLYEGAVKNCRDFKQNQNRKRS